MADLADFYPPAQQVPQTVNGTQPAKSVTPASTTGAPALWVLLIIGAGILLLHLGE